MKSDVTKGRKECGISDISKSNGNTDKERTLFRKFFERKSSPLVGDSVESVSSSFKMRETIENDGNDYDDLN